MIGRFLFGVDKLGVSVDAATGERLFQYANEMLAANRYMNLTSVPDGEPTLELHILDSLAALRVLDQQPHVLPLIDVGTGAGWPGIALACARPRWRCVLIDSNRRKAEFVKKGVRRLGLNNAEVVWARAETLAHQVGFREAFATVVARAVAPLNVLAEFGLPFLEVGGCMIALKGERGREEAEAAAQAINLLGGEIGATDDYVLPFSGAARTLIVVNKVRSTPLKYPRRPGIPTKRPL